MKIRSSTIFIGLMLLVFCLISPAGGAPRVDFSEYDPSCLVKFKSTGDDTLIAQWGDDAGRRYRAGFNLGAGKALVEFLEAADARDSAFTRVAGNINPRYRLTVGSRLKGLGWYHVFFDRVDQNIPGPVKYDSELKLNRVRVESDGPCRARIAFADFTAGPFRGELACLIYAGSPFLHFQAALRNDEPWTAYLYEALFHGPYENIVFQDLSGTLVSRIASSRPTTPAPLKVKHRLVMGTFTDGTVAVFPPPHAYFYPVDLSDNRGYGQAGKGVIGIRQDYGSDPWRPWIDAPRGKTQRLDAFLLFGAEHTAETLRRVKRYTNGDSMKPLPGHHTLAEHFHPEFAMNRIRWNRDACAPFREAMLALGVDIVHLCEFHYAGDHPGDDTGIRLFEQKIAFDICREYSIESRFLLIPGEEPNYALGAQHWTSLFPKPVYWIMSRGPGRAFKENHPLYGTVYRVGNEEDMHRLLKEENAAAWTAHPRIKGSEKSPDNLLSHAFYRDDLWQAGDWKSMPLDLSEDRLGSRGFKLMDDTAQWGFRKYMLGEVDTFGLDSSHELYGHLNVNYLRLKAFPSKTDWSEVVECVKRGDFFTTTGEVLIRSWKASAGEVTAELEWYFPLAFAEIVWGEAAGVKRRRIPLRETREFGRARFHWPLDLRNARWVRLEAWDIARNGAFTQPFWLAAPSPPVVLPGKATGITLIDADLDLPVPGFDPIPNGAVLKLSQLPPRLALRLETDPLVVGSVRLDWDGREKFKTENGWPYTLGESRVGEAVMGTHTYDYLPFPLKPGSHALAAVCFSGADLRGTAGEKAEFRFTVTE